jgi:small-conductance mechanosensitive channel
MIHPHSDQRSVQVPQRASALSPYSHLVNASVSPLELHSSALMPTRHKDYLDDVPSAVDGEVLNVVTVPTWDDTDAREPKRSLLRRAIDDPFWILITMTTVLGLSIAATVIYGVIQIALAIAEWFHANGTTLAAITTLVLLLMLCGGATAAKCAGIHCGGCRG